MSRGGARIGVFGGTFNPIHLGHLRAAEEVRERLSLDEIRFVPAADPPLKRPGSQPIAPAESQPIAPAEERLRWVAAAVRENPSFCVDDLELRRAGPSYTVDTLREIGRRRPGARLVFLVGEDAFGELDLWREPEALLALADFAVMTRPPGRALPLRELLPRALGAPLAWSADGESATHPTAGTRAERVRIAALAISATEIRDRIRSGRSVRYLLPEAVHDLVLASKAYA